MLCFIKEVKTFKWLWYFLHAHFNVTMGTFGSACTLSPAMPLNYTLMPPVDSKILDGHKYYSKAHVIRGNLPATSSRQSPRRKVNHI